MKNKSSGSVSVILIGLGAIVYGLLTIKARGFSTGTLGNWVVLSADDAHVLAYLIIACGLGILTIGLRYFFKKNLL